ncbi:DGQHR domain protein [Calothrix sp. NIES-2100]|uniref:DNA sulfur modification protein DndB n=1 Tax=Calothrix sp. NIES-2100 TaxID=1954172 RepID=UPI000B61A9D9|nr:DGQHR domain protein [Calothrix sp. NIES-2100]
MTAFKYVFPVIRGIQNESEFYLCWCPVQVILELFTFKEEMAVPASVRRSLNSTFNAELAKNIITKPLYTSFYPLIIFIDGEVTFEAINLEKDTANLGHLKVPIDTKTVVLPVHNPIAALKLAHAQNPDLGNLLIPLHFYQDIGLKRLQQLKTAKSIILNCINPELGYHSRPMILAISVITEVNIFKDLTDVERSSLPMRSQKLFTLSGIRNATLTLLVNHEKADLETQIQLAIRYWNAVCANIPDWERVREGKISSGKIRQDFVHGHGVTLAALGHLGAELISLYPEDWEVWLHKLQQINWSRSNPEWENRVIFGDRISKSRTSVSLLTSYLQKCLDLPLTPKSKSVPTKKHNQE